MAKESKKPERKPRKSTMRPVDRKTGCKVGSKGDLIGLELLKKADHVSTFSAIMALVAKFYEEAKDPQTPAQVRRYAIVWIDTLKKQHPEIYGKLSHGVAYSIAHRIALRNNRPQA